MSPFAAFQACMLKAVDQFNMLNAFYCKPPIQRRSTLVNLAQTRTARRQAHATASAPRESRL
ncbi:MAG: hypothetical protein DME22_12350 [Verrucomicrobia bacterium]|nr:MAG: hypothetical protein DME22_12350 [Verrucomicrobiota bacterium]